MLVAGDPPTVAVRPADVAIVAGQPGRARLGEGHGGDQVTGGDAGQYLATLGRVAGRATS